MNNSLARLADGMIATLRREIIPKLDDEFARGQAFGVIYMLNSLKLRATWSIEFVGHQVDEVSAVFDRLRKVVPNSVAHPDFPDLTEPSGRVTAGALEALRDRGDRALCNWIEWLDTSAAGIPPDVAAAVRTELRDYMNGQTRYEMSTSARPMFAEISRGAEDV